MFFNASWDGVWLDFCWLTRYRVTGEIHFSINTTQVCPVHHDLIRPVMSTEEEKTQTQPPVEAVKGPSVITGGASASGMVNNLIPPLGTMYFGQ